MKISQALNAVRILGMDTAPFIYLVEKHPTYEDRILAVFQQVGKGALEVATSMLTLTEVLTMPLIKKQRHYADEYREMLLNTVHVYSIQVDAAIAERAAELRASYGLKTPDAIQVATALSAGCQAFLTNDLGLKRLKEIQVLVLGELEIG